VSEPGVRDPEFPCTDFTPGTPTTAGVCETDGHYMCDGCVYRATAPCCGQRPAHCECAALKWKFALALGAR